MPAPKDPPAQLIETGPRWPMCLIIALLAAAVMFILVPSEPAGLTRLAQHRADVISRRMPPDLHPLIGYFRDLDGKLSPDARVFFSGIIGQEKIRHMDAYYFARTYLFPREVEISLDHQAKFHGWFEGIDCASPDELRTNGYDVMLSLEKNGDVTVLPLTEKGKLNR